jgi:2-C-methyl-D-erythritol 4-phosphate cytidylyltransferase
MKTVVILPSGGEGKRFGSSLPKQYIKVNGKEILAHTISVFEKCSMVDEIVIASGETYFGLINNLIKENNFLKPVKIVKGGKERQDSVFNALSSLSCNAEDLIVVHDAVRPLLSGEILLTALNSAKIFDNVVVGIKARDTLIQSDNSENFFVENYVDREKVFYAQTPQIFRYSVLIDSMKKAQNEGFIGTDESMLVKRAGYKIKIIEGSSLNFKITNSDDLHLFDTLVRFYNLEM